MFILISFFTSCKKTVLKIKVRGEVVGLTGGEPIPDADVYIIRHQETDMFSYGISEEVYRSKTKHKGEFEFDFKRERGWKYTLYARKKEYFDEESTRGVQSYIVLDQLGSPLNRKVKLYLCEPAFLGLRMINKSGFSKGFKFTSSTFYYRSKSKYGLIVPCESIDTLVNDLIIASGRELTVDYSIVDSMGDGVFWGKKNLLSYQPFQYNEVVIEY